MVGKRVRTNRVFSKDERESVIASMVEMHREGKSYAEVARIHDRDVSNSRKQIIAWEKANAAGQIGTAIMRNHFAPTNVPETSVGSVDGSNGPGN